MGGEQQFLFFGPITKDSVDNFNQAISCLVKFINQLKDYYREFFKLKHEDFIWDQEKINNNTEIKLSNLFYDLKKENQLEWTLNWKVISINFLMLIYCQEKKEEIEFLDSPKNIN